MRTQHSAHTLSRRSCLKIGALGMSGLTLADSLRLAEAGATGGQARSAIFISLQGGPSHLETFDMKPDAPQELRGEFKPIQTNVPGLEISEHLPRLAACADKFAVLRGVSHNLADHTLGTDYLVTGNRPVVSLKYPGYGAVVSKELPVAADLPAYVAIPQTAETNGYLSVEFAALRTDKSPVVGEPFELRGISIGRQSLATMARRENLLKDLDTSFDRLEGSEVVQGLDRYSARAFDILRSPKSRAAFDISQEPPEISQLFVHAEKPRTRSFAASCLLACRLVEAGVRFVTVQSDGWDTHSNNFKALKDDLLPPLDVGLSALLQALEKKGLLETTSVLVTGEFGRTPKVNARAGRDHWPRAMCCLLAGGGIKGGQVLGASDDKGEGPVDGGFKPDDVAATFFHTLGIDHAREYHTSTGRPVMIVRDGRVISELMPGSGG